MVALGVTGTPGVGKTVVANILSARLGLPLIKLSDIASRFQIDVYKDSKVIDTDMLEKYILDTYSPPYILEGHLLCVMSLPLDYLFVLRTEPSLLMDRLSDRGWDPDKIQTNVEAEALDYCLIHAEQNYKNVVQLDTTNKSPEQVVNKIISIINGSVEADEVDWSDFIFNRF